MHLFTCTSINNVDFTDIDIRPISTPMAPMQSCPFGCCLINNMYMYKGLYHQDIK